MGQLGLGVVFWVTVLFGGIASAQVFPASNKFYFTAKKDLGPMAELKIDEAGTAELVMTKSSGQESFVAIEKGPARLITLFEPGRKLVQALDSELDIALYRTNLINGETANCRHGCPFIIGNWLRILFDDGHIVSTDLTDIHNAGYQHKNSRLEIKTQHLPGEPYGIIHIGGYKAAPNGLTFFYTPEFIAVRKPKPLGDLDIPANSNIDKVEFDPSEAPTRVKFFSRNGKELVNIDFSLVDIERLYTLTPAPSRENSTAKADANGIANGKRDRRQRRGPPGPIKNYVEQYGDLILPNFDPSHYDAKMVDENKKEIDAYDLMKTFSRDLVATVRDELLKLDADGKRVLQVDQSPAEKAIREEIYEILLMGETGNVKYLGPGGSGKSYSVKQIIANLMLGDGPRELIENTYWISIDASALAASAKHMGDSEGRAHAIIQVAKALKKEGKQLIVFVDEAHTLKGQGAHSRNENDSIQLLKPFIADGTLKVFAATTTPEWNNSYAGDVPFDSRFEPVLREGSGHEDTVAKLKVLAHIYYQADLDPAIAERIYELSEQFDSIGVQPRKGAKLLHRFFAYLRAKGLTPSLEALNSVATKRYRLDPSEVDESKAVERLQRVTEYLDKILVGQAQAKQMILDILADSMLGWAPTGKPRGSAILSGPSGQGQTLMLQGLAKAMGVPMIEVNMPSIASLIDFERTLVSKLRNASGNAAFALIVLDHLERVPPALQHAVVSLLESGRITVLEKIGTSSAVTAIDINLRNNTIFMPTNAGADYLMAQKFMGFQFLPQKQSYSEIEHRQHLAKDGLERSVIKSSNVVIPFLPATEAEFLEIFTRNIQTVVERVKAKSNVTVVFGPNTLKRAIESIYKTGVSNDEAERLAQSLRFAIARTVLTSKSREISVDFDGSKFYVSQTENAPAVAAVAIPDGLAMLNPGAPAPGACGAVTSRANP